MKYIVTILLLSVMTLHANNEYAHVRNIKELEAIRFSKLTEVATLSCRILKETDLCFEYESIALNYWRPLIDDINREKSFKECIIELYEAFDMGDDINSILDKAPLLSDDDRTQLDLVMLRVVLQRMLITELTMQYRQLITEIVKINKALQALRP